MIPTLWPSHAFAMTKLVWVEARALDIVVPDWDGASEALYEDVDPGLKLNLIRIFSCPPR